MFSHIRDLTPTIREAGKPCRRQNRKQSFICQYFKAKTFLLLQKYLLKKIHEVQIEMSVPLNVVEMSVVFKKRETFLCLGMGWAGLEGRRRVSD